ncbi:MAG: hypothetical protein KC583_13005 [Myxococcales bacterium]|nr:hypothetical protein [Myxococcales bacterium]
MHRHLRALGLAAATVGCRAEPPAEQPTPAVDAAPTMVGDRAALQRAWRDSVKYRAGFVALADNAPAYARDVDKARRMLAETEALKRMPVVADPGTDAEVVRRALVGLGEQLKAGPGFAVAVTPRPLAPLPPARIAADQKFDYTRDQIVGAHGVEVTLPDALRLGPAFVRALRDLDRMVVPTTVRLEGSRAALSADAYFLRDVPPVTFHRPTVDVSSLLRDAAKTPLDALRGKPADLAAKTRANYAQVEARAADIEKSFAHQAHLEIETARFKFYARIDRAQIEATWSRLVGGKGADGPE